MQTVNAVWGALLLTVHFIGILAFGFWLMLRLLRTGRKNAFAVIVPLREPDNAVERVYAQHLRLILTGELQRGCVIALDLGLDEEQKRACRQFCRSLRNTYYCAPEELSALLLKLQKET